MAKDSKFLYSIAGAFLCLVFAGGFVFQLATDTVCFTKLSFTYLGNSAFWLLIYFFIIKDKRSDQELGTHWILSHLLIAISLVFANQIAVYGFVEGSFQIIFNCSSEYGMWGELQINNLILHVTLYFLLVGLDLYFRKKAQDDDHSGSRNRVINIRKNGKIYRIETDDIVYLEASQNAVILHTQHQDFWMFQSLKSILEEIGNPKLKRIHRSYAVNQEFIEFFTPKPSGDGTIRLYNNVILKVSRNYKHTLQISSLNPQAT